MSEQNKLIKAAFEKDLNQFFTDSLSPDRGYSASATNLDAVFQAERTRADDWRKMAERLAEELKPVAVYNFQVGNSVHAISSSREYVEGCVQRHNERISSANKAPAKVVPANSRAEALDAFNALLAREENK